jgi:hypothetical protein
VINDHYVFLQEFAYRHDMQYFETSCYDGTNVELVVMTMVARLMPEETEQSGKEDTSGSTTQEHKQKKETASSCCIT